MTQELQHSFVAEKPQITLVKPFVTLQGSIMNSFRYFACTHRLVKSNWIWYYVASPLFLSTLGNFKLTTSYVLIKGASKQILLLFIFFFLCAHCATLT